MNVKSPILRIAALMSIAVVVDCRKNWKGEDFQRLRADTKKAGFGLLNPEPAVDALDGDVLIDVKGDSARCNFGHPVV